MLNFDVFVTIIANYQSDLEIFLSTDFKLFTFLYPLCKYLHVYAFHIYPYVKNVLKRYRLLFSYFRKSVKFCLSGIQFSILNGPYDTDDGFFLVFSEIFYLSLSAYSPHYLCPWIFFISHNKNLNKNLLFLFPWIMLCSLVPFFYLVSALQSGSCYIYFILISFLFWPCLCLACFSPCLR